MNDKITRRDAARLLGAGAATFPILNAQHQHGVAAQAKASAPYTMKVFNAAQAEEVAALAETIIPTTTSPGGRAAKAQEFIDQTLGDDKPNAEKFLTGLKWIDDRSTKLFGKNFAQLDSAQQVELLTRISDAQKNVAPEDKPGAAFFRQLKPLVCTAYYTTQVGLEQEIGYLGNTFLTEFHGCDDQGEPLPGTPHRHKRKGA